MRLLFLIIFLLYAVAASAEVTDETDWVEEEEKTSIGDNISKRVDRMADGIDMLLAGKRYTKMENRSSAKINQVVTHSEGGVIRTSTDFNLNLRLPNLEKRWAVRFTSYDEEEESRDLQQRRLQTRPRRREYGAAVGFFKKLGNIKTTFQPRLVLKDPLEMSYVLRFESSAGTRLKLIPRLDLFADPLKGTGEFVSLELVYRATKRFEISIQNEEEYRERDNLFTTNHGLSFDYGLTKDKGVGLSFLWGSSSRPSFHLDTFTIATKFGHEIYRERLAYALTPFLLFAKSDRFKGDVGVTLSVAVTF